MLPSRPHKKQPGVSHALVLGAYLLLTIVMTWPLALNFATAIPGDSFDGWQNYWNQWWLKVALIDRQTNPFRTDLLYYPTGVGLYFHTLNPFNGVTTLPVQLSFGLIPAYNTVVLLSWSLAGYGTYLLALWWLRSRAPQADAESPSPRAAQLAAFLAGLIFTFSPFHMAHLLGHMQVMALQWLPFYLLYLLRAWAQQQHGQSWLRSALLAGFFLVLTGLCDWYFVLYLFVFTGLALLWQGLVAWRAGRAPWSVLAPPVVAGASFALLLAPILVPMVREALSFQFMVRPASDLYILSASVMDFLVPNRLHTLWRPESFTWIGNQIAPISERTISIGYLPLLLTLLAALWDRRRAGFWLVGAALFFVLALGPRPHLGNITWQDLPPGSEIVERWTPYALLNRLVPFMRISRSVSRHALMVQLCLAVVAAIGLWMLTRRWAPTQPRRQWGLGIAASLIVLAEFWVAPYPLSPPDTPPFYEQLRTQSAPGSDTRALLNLPMNYDRPGYLLYQTVHQQPLTVAYISRDDPRTWTERVATLQHFRQLGPDILGDDPAHIGPTVLHDLGVGTVVLDRYKMPGGAEREYTEALAGAIFAEQTPLFSDERITVYAVTVPTTAQPYLSLGEQFWGPLRAVDGSKARQLIGSPALLGLHHLPPAAHLRIRYRSAPGADLRVEGEGDTQLYLPAAPAGATQTVSLAQLGIQREQATLQFVPSVADSVWIEEISLLVVD